MAFTVNQFTLPKVAASTIGAHLAVRTSASTADEVVVVATSNVNTFLGLTTATGASVGNPVPIVYDGVAKAVAGASVGLGADVGVASTNGALGPIASAATQFRVGISQTAAAAGEIFSVLLRPERVDF